MENVFHIHVMIICIITCTTDDALDIQAVMKLHFSQMTELVKNTKYQKIIITHIHIVLIHLPIKNCLFHQFEGFYSSF